MRDEGTGLARSVRAAIAALAFALCGYGYGGEADPFIAAWKAVAADANGGRWAEARDASRGLDAGFSELETNLGLSLRAPLAQALQARDGRALARELTVAACGLVLWKLESSRRAGLDDYYAAKYRIDAARSAYLELLAPAVRARDAARGTHAHDQVLAALDAAQAALGRPGFLGRGVRGPDAAAFLAAERDLQAALRSAFPFAPEVTS